MGRKFDDLTGQKFGRLVVLKRVEDYISTGGRRRIIYLCRCDCGNKITVRGDNLKNGHTKSCGCLNNEVITLLGKSKKKFNKYDLSGEYGIGYTSKGEPFYFDLEDYDLIKDYCWHIDKDGYIVTKDNNKNRILFHRLVMNCPEDMVVDHRYGRKTRNNNRKYNLRICTQHENSMNCATPINNTSGVKGVNFDKSLNKWEARIVYDYKTIRLGRFDNIEDAIKSRKDAEKKYFGKFNYDSSQESKGILHV